MDMDLEGILDDQDGIQGTVVVLSNACFHLSVDSDGSCHVQVQGVHYIYLGTIATVPSVQHSHRLGF